MEVTILGGTGLLGRHLAPRLTGHGHQVIATGRTVAPQAPPGVRLMPVDLATGDGIADAIGPADHVVHLASDFSDPERVDVEGTARLLGSIGDRHLTYVSIVGVDRHPLPYYRAKLAAERMIATRAGRYSILRVTQFHDLMAHRIRHMTRFPLGVLPRGQLFQPIDVGEVADALVGMVETSPHGMIPDLAGPEVLEIGRLARAYLAATGQTKPLLEVPFPGRQARAYRAGALTNPGRALGRITWVEYLTRRFGAESPR